MIKLTHFGSNIHDVVIIKVFIFAGKIRVVDSRYSRSSKRGVTGFLDLLEGSGSSESIRR